MKREYYSANMLGRTLHVFERKYGMTSEEFYSMVQDGEPTGVSGFSRALWTSVYREYCELCDGGDFAATVERTLQLV